MPGDNWNVAEHFPQTYTAQIPGLLASGTNGYIDIFNVPWYEGALRQISLDVVWWRLYLGFDQSPLAMSGQMGSMDGRQVGYSYSYEALCLWNVPAVPEMLLRGIMGAELVFFLGNYNWGQKMWEGTSQAGNDLTPDDDRYYWCKRAALKSSVPMLNAGEKKMTRVQVAGVARSHIFLCPDMGNPRDETTFAGAYNSWYEENHE
jgi:hypothetical protein